MSDGANELVTTLRRNGYEPVPIKPGTKHPAVNGWQCGRIDDDAWSPGCGIGVLCGHGDLVAVDIDTDDPAVIKAVNAVLPPGCPRKRGRKGVSVLMRAKVPKKIKLPVGFASIDGKWTVCNVEVLTVGQQTVIPPSVHPDTKRPYEWVAGPDDVVRSLYDMSIDDVPRLDGDSEEALQRSLAALVVPKELIKACKAIASAANGERNDTFNREVFKLATGKADIREDVAKRWLTAAARYVGLDEAEIAATFKSAADSARDRLAGGKGANEKPRRNRPRVRIRGGSLSKNATEAEEHLIKAGVQVYRRASTLVHPVTEEVPAADGRKTRSAALHEVSEPYLRDLLCRHMEWQRWDVRKKKDAVGERWREVDPPNDVVKTILARAGEWKFPAAMGIITTPTMRPDGSLLTDEGYDEATGLILFEPPKLPPIPIHPTKDDAIAALALLDQLLVEFPFADQPSRSVALSALITPVVRAALPAVPMHAITAPTPGSGKSYLVDLAAAISSGAPCPVIGKGESAGELEKRLNTSLIAGHPMVSIDNVDGELKGDFLCLAIERPVTDIRILGRTKHARIHNAAVLFATGNNLRLVGDVVRRTLVSSIDAHVERPELHHFKANPVKMVLDDRGRYIAAALTIVRAYQIAGSPSAQGSMQLASFQAWSDTVRSSLMWLGCADPVATMETARENDPELEALKDVVTAMASRFGYGPTAARTTAQIVASAYQSKDLRKDNPLRDALDGLRQQGKSIDSLLLGQWLARHKDRVVANLQLVKKPRGGKNASAWYVHDLRRK